MALYNGLIGNDEKARQWAFAEYPYNEQISTESSYLQLYTTKSIIYTANANMIKY